MAMKLLFLVKVFPMMMMNKKMNRICNNMMKCTEGSKLEFRITMLLKGREEKERDMTRLLFRKKCGNQAIFWINVSELEIEYEETKVEIPFEIPKWHTKER